MLATAKQFRRLWAPEGGRDYNIAEIPEVTLRRHLPPSVHAPSRQERAR